LEVTVGGFYDNDWSMHRRDRRGPPSWWHTAPPWAAFVGEWMRGPSPRAERGTVRWLVLDAIAERPRHGYEIIQSIAERSGGTYKPSPGVVYPTLQLLEELGHARIATRDDRKTYEITAEGRRALAEHASEVTEFYEQGDEGAWEEHADDVAKVMKRIARVMHLFKHAMRRGAVRPATLRKMRGILDDALHKLEDLLTTEDL
jgi:DNA-binding PadR family transcriptional regulator